LQFPHSQPWEPLSALLRCQAREGELQVRHPSLRWAVSQTCFHSFIQLFLPNQFKSAFYLAAKSLHGWKSKSCLFDKYQPDITHTKTSSSWPNYSTLLPAFHYECLQSSRLQLPPRAAVLPAFAVSLLLPFLMILDNARFPFATNPQR